jgi:hypothetical protein
MSSQTPPSPYFSGINFNSAFFSVVSSYLTETIANSKYLKLLGGTLSGFLGILRAPRVAIDVNGQAVINNGTSGNPTNGQFGGNGTKLILDEGTAGKTPIGLGTNTNDLWLGVSGSGAHRFYTGTNERLRINNDGNIGIGTNNPQVSLDLYNDVNGGNSPYIKLRGGGGPNNSVGFILNPYYNRTALTTTKIYAIDDGAASANLCFATADSGSATEAVERMRIKTNGNIGIGTNDPQSKLHLHTPTNATYVSLRMTDNTSGTGATDGIAIIKTDAQDMFLHVYENARMMFFTNNNTRMILSADGNLCIGNTAPSNILQVGDGGKLRISNNTTDYTLIGTKDTNDANNTRIELSGSTRSSRTGYIDYHAVSGNGLHVFFVNQVVIASISSAGLSINNGSIALTNGSYRNGGFSVAYGGKLRSGTGTVTNGYFIDPVLYSNSLMICALSHDSTSYQVWNGRISVNKNGAITDVSNFYAPNVMIVENFIELSTLKSWIYINPNTSYNTATNLFAKIYG